MRDINYKVTVVDLDSEPLPAWLDDRLKRWFATLLHELPPPKFVRLLRQLKDDQRPTE